MRPPVISFRLRPQCVRIREGRGMGARDMGGAITSVGHDGHPGERQGEGAGRGFPGVEGLRRIIAFCCMQ
jgi:hypothetical protein